MQKKQEYVKKVERHLEQWKQKIDDMKADTQKARERVNSTYDTELKLLSQKQQRAHEQLQQLKSKTPDDFQAAKSSLDRTVQEIHDEYQRLVHIASSNEDEEHLGWAQGLADHLDSGSLGWAEGQADHVDDDSLGWSEGQADQVDDDSQGWAEGMTEEPVKA